VEIAFDITNMDERVRHVLVDFHVHFIKANGKSSPKVFKLRTTDLALGETVGLKKTVSLAEMTTRKHYAGTHTINVVLNGRPEPLDTFELAQRWNDPELPAPNPSTAN